jgi:transcriptional regulatory protein LEU3
MGCLQHCSTNVGLAFLCILVKANNFRVSTGNGQPSITLYDSTLDFKVDDEEHMRIIPPTLFVRLRQEMAASRINKLLYSVNSRRFGEGAAISYMSLEADRLKEERAKEESGSLDGVDSGTLYSLYPIQHHGLTFVRFGGSLSLRRRTTPSFVLFL